MENKTGEIQTIQPTDGKKSVAQEMIQAIATIAKDKEADISKMERLLEVQIKMMDRQAEIEFNKDFHSMKLELPVIEKKGEIKKKDGTVTSKYSRYEDLHENVNPILNKYGFSFSHNTEPYNDKIIVVSTLSHTGGHKKTFRFITPMDQSNALKSPMQAAKSTANFGKRTNFINSLDITEVTEESEIISGQVITVEQAEYLEDLIRETNSDRDKLLKFCGVDNTLDITIAKFTEAERVLRAKIGKSV